MTVCSTTAIELLTDEECRKFKITLALAPLLLLSVMSQLSDSLAPTPSLTGNQSCYPGSHLFGPRGQLFMPLSHCLATKGHSFTWNGGTFKDCLIVDQIGEVEEGMIGLKLSGHAVSMIAAAAEKLFKTAAEQQTLSITEKCQDISLLRGPIYKTTLIDVTGNASRNIPNTMCGLVGTFLISAKMFLIPCVLWAISGTISNMFLIPNNIRNNLCVPDIMWNHFTMFLIWRCLFSYYDNLLFISSSVLYL
jgi:hypothetical protein